MLTLVALAIRLLYAYHSKWDQAINGDAFYYHYQANGLIHGNGFQLYHQRANGAVVPVGAADNRPLYVLYLAAFSLVGLSSFHAHMIATCLLGAAGVAATGLLGRELVGERTGLIAAGIACVYANYWVYDPLVTSESLTILLVALMLLFAVRFWKAPSFGRGAVLGVIVALGALTRSELLLFLPIVVIPVLWRLRADWRRRIAIVVVSGLAALLILSPWMIRGLTAFHRPIPLSGGFGVAIASANCHDTYYGDLLGWWSARCNGPLPKGDASDRDFVLRKKGFDYIDNHLGRFPVVALARVGRMWEVFRPGWFWGKANISQTVLLDVIEGRTLTAAAYRPGAVLRPRPVRRRPGSSCCTAGDRRSFRSSRFRSSRRSRRSPRSGTRATGPPRRWSSSPRPPSRSTPC